MNKEHDVTALALLSICDTLITWSQEHKMAQPQLEQRVIEAAKDVDRIWRNEGPYTTQFNTALALLSRSLSKLKVWREGRREEAIQEIW